jgi:hypothetical protein
MGRKIPTRPFEPIDPTRESYLEQLLGRYRQGKSAGPPPDVVLKARAMTRRLEAAIKGRPFFAVTVATAAAFALGSLLGRTRFAGALGSALGGTALILFLRGPGKSEMDRILAIAEADYEDISRE